MQTVRRAVVGYVITGLVCLVIGYFVGREHLKYELRAAFQSAAKGVQEAFGGVKSDASQPPKEKKEDKPVASPKPKESPIAVVLTKKGFNASDWQAGTYDDAITFSVAFTNGTGMDIRAFDGVLTFTDLLDNQIIASTLAINDPVAAGTTFNWDGQLDYNQFMDSHQRLRAEERSNLKITFAPRKILFVDGSVKEYE
jgi:hypothetical protein